MPLQSECRIHLAEEEEEEEESRYNDSDCQSHKLTSDLLCVSEQYTPAVVDRVGLV